MRLKLVFGDAFVDRSLLGGEADEFYLRPLHDSAKHRDAATKVLRSFDMKLVTDLADVHRRLDVPVRPVWGDQDPFFPGGLTERFGTTRPVPTDEMTVQLTA